MPKVTSLSGPSSRNKENVAPAIRSRGQKTNRKDSEDLEEDDVEEELSGLREAKRARSKAAPSASRTKHTEREGKVTIEAPKTQFSSSSNDSAALKRSGRNDENSSSSEGERKGKRERILEEKLASLTRERDQIQGQFDDLREARQTRPELLLAEWRKLADQRDHQANEYIAKLKAQIKAMEGKRDIMSSSSDGAFIRGPKEGQSEEWAGREKRLREEVARLTQELSTSSLALKSKTGSGSMGYSDEKAIRRLYEDLTGLVVNKVEQVQDKGKANFRSYHAIFASAGFYNLEMRLEESESDLSSSEASRVRQDLIYVPALDPNRDEEVLTSGHLPSYLKESLRFERSTAVRFMNTLHKKLDRQSKRTH